MSPSHNHPFEALRAAGAPSPHDHGDEWQQTAAALLADRLTVPTLLESLAEGAIAVNEGGIIVLVNRRTEELFGYRRDELVGRRLDVLLPARFESVHSQHMRGYFADPRIRPMGQGLDLTGRRSDGREFPVEIGLSYLETGAGWLGLAFITDITQRKEAEEALKQRNAELDAFAHTVAHDMRSSVSLLVGYSELLLESHRNMGDEELHDYLTMMAHSGRKMIRVIEELLLFARARQEDVELAPLDTGSIVKEALDRLREMIAEYQAEIVTPPAFPVALGYAPWLEEVWYNYLNNALKYGGRPPRVELGGARQADGYVKFWVSDNGAGLAADEQADLFGPRSRPDATPLDGSGLGLSIVRRIVEKLGGQVAVESQPGQGSTFSFTLPGG